MLTKPGDVLRTIGGGKHVIKRVHDGSGWAAVVVVVVVVVVAVANLFVCCFCSSTSGIGMAVTKMEILCVPTKQMVIDGFSTVII